MSDLISREALLKVIRDDRLTNASDAIYFITNAPAVSGEAILYAVDGYKEALRIHNGATLCTEKPTDLHKLPLFTTPQQPKSVADALEEAAKICDDYANSNFGSLVDSGQNGAYVCSKAIRALIKRNTQKEGE